MGVLIVLATLCAYQPVWRGEFIWDDAVSLIGNPLIRRNDGLLAIWFSSQPHDYFPLTYTSFWLEHRAWGLNPIGYHLTNILLHACSALLTWRLLTRLRIPGARLAALIFALHPVCVASVAWIAERKNTLSLPFLLLSFLLYQKFQETAPTCRSRPRAYWLAVVSFTMALLAKSSGVGLPVIFLLYIWWRSQRISKSDVISTFPFFVAAGLSSLATLWFQAHRAIGAAEVVQAESLWQRAAAAGWAIWFYLYKILLPIRLSAIYPRWDLTAASAFALVPLALFLALFVTAWLFRAKWGRHLVFALGSFAICLLPILGLVDMYYLTYSRVADHWAYLALVPIVGLAIAGLSCLAHPRPGKDNAGRQSVLIVLMLALPASLGFATFQRAAVYANELAFWTDTVRKNGASAVACNNLANALDDRGQTQRALPLYLEALRLNPAYATAHNNLGALYAKLGQPARALEHYQAALRLDAGFASAHNNLGVLLLESGKLQEARESFAAVLRLQPEHAGAHYNFGRLLQQEGKLNEALNEYSTAIRCNPGLPEAYNNAGVLRMAQSNFDNAAQLLSRAVALAPGWADAHYNLSLALHSLGRTQEAALHLQAALRLNSNLAPLINHTNQGTH